MPLDPNLRQSCNRFLSWHLTRTQHEWLEVLARSPLAELPPDRYGEGPAIATLEREMAELLGKEATIYLHKGVVAQQMALRVWTARSGCPTVALHPKSHIDLDESNAYERLLNLTGARVGQDYAPFTAAELAAVGEPIGVVTVELPLRRAGFKLPSWAELEAIAAWCHEHGVPLHIDGARLWEAQPYYGRAHAEIAALADSVYVSFYKGLGGLAGCVLAGSAEFIAATRIWQTRLGGNLYTVFPYVLAAYEGWHEQGPKMGGYYARAKEIAGALTEALPVHIAPDPPQCNCFQIYLPGKVAALESAANRLAERDQVWLFNYLYETAVPGLTMGEVQIYEAAEQWTTPEVVAAFRDLLALAARS